MSFRNNSHLTTNPPKHLLNETQFKAHSYPGKKAQLYQNLNQPPTKSLGRAK